MEKQRILWLEVALIKGLPAVEARTRPQRLFKSCVFCFIGRKDLYLKYSMNLAQVIAKCHICRSSNPAHESFELYFTLRCIIKSGISYYQYYVKHLIYRASFLSLSVPLTWISFPDLLPNCLYLQYASNSSESIFTFLLWFSSHNQYHLSFQCLVNML